MMTEDRGFVLNTDVSEVVALMMRVERSLTTRGSVIGQLPENLVESVIEMRGDDLYVVCHPTAEFRAFARDNLCEN